MADTGSGGFGGGTGATLVLGAILDIGAPGFLTPGGKVATFFEDIVAREAALLGLESPAIGTATPPAEELVAGAPGREGASVEILESAARDLLKDLGDAADFVLPHTLSVEGLLEKLSELLLKPPRIPGEPCLAPTPLLRDLLDVALGKIRGGIGATVAKVGQTVLGLLTPAAIEGDDLAHFVQAILDDPITAALNLILGMQNQIDCEVTARKDVGESVIEMGFKRLVGFIEKALA